jgi:hypothetical protein
MSRISTLFHLAVSCPSLWRYLPGYAGELEQGDQPWQLQQLLSLQPERLLTGPKPTPPALPVVKMPPGLAWGQALGGWDALPPWLLYADDQDHAEHPPPKLPQQHPQEL